MEKGGLKVLERREIVLLLFPKHNLNSAQILKANRGIQMDFKRPGKMPQEGNGVTECRFSFWELFHRPFELKWSNVSFLAWKSRLFAMGLSPSTEAKHVQRLRVRSLQAGWRVRVDARKKTKCFFPLEQIIVDSNKIFGWENCLLTVLSLIQSCLQKAKLCLHWILTKLDSCKYKQNTKERCWQLCYKTNGERLRGHHWVMVLLGVF